MKKKILLLGLIILPALLMILPINASASVMDPVSFYLLDDDADGNDGFVSLDTYSFNLEESCYLQYDIGSGFEDWPPDGDFSVSTKKLIYFQITDGSDTDSSGELVFSGSEGTYHGIEGYGSLLIFWDETETIKVEFTVTSPSNLDHVGPVPIPATVWIFGAGLVGLVGIRRKLRSC